MTAARVTVRSSTNSRCNRSARSRIDPKNPKNVWVGTGESWTRNSVSIGDGIYKSTDGGETWTNAGLPNSERIAKIVVSPKNSDTVFAGVPGALWSDSPDRGLYKTTDGGKTWELVLKGSKPFDRLLDRRDRSQRSEHDVRRAVGFPPQRLDLPLRRRRSRTHRRAADCSARPTAARPGPRSRPENSKGFPKKPYGRIAVAIAPSNPKRVYAFVESTDSALFVSDDGGSTWDKRDKSQWMVWRPFYFANLIVDPKNPDRVFKTDGALIVSEDAGKSFATVGGFQWRAWRRPRRLDRSDQSANGHLRRRRRDVVFLRRRQQMVEGENLPVSQFYHVSVDDDDPYHVYGGLQDNSSWVGDSQYPGGITNRAVGKHVRRRRFLDVRRSGRSRLHLRRIPGRLHRPGQSPHARSARHPAQAELQGKAALQLEHADRAFA